MSWIAAAFGRCCGVTLKAKYDSPTALSYVANRAPYVSAGRSDAQPVVANSALE